MFVDDWAGLLRIVVVVVVVVVGVGGFGFLSLVALLRMSGKRSLAELNAFDFVATVALGSTLATVLLSSDVALVEGVVAMVLLVGLQFLVVWLSVRSRTVERLVTSEPTLLHGNGFLGGPMRRRRFTEDEIRQAARAAGNARLDTLAPVVLETDGSLSILTEVPAVLSHTGPHDLRDPGR